MTHDLGRFEDQTLETREFSMRVLATMDVEEFRRALDEDGFVIFRDVVDQDKLAELDATLLEEFERAKTAGELFEGGGSLSGHLNCFPGEAAGSCGTSSRHTASSTSCGQVRPDIADSVRATLNFNLPGSVAQHYHMDGLYLKDFLICNIAVVDTDLVNGAIDVLPGTNREFYKFWRYALERKYRLTTRVPLPRATSSCASRPCGTAACRTRPATPRPMMAITFGEMEDTAGDPFMVNDGKIVFYPNWYKTSRLGQLRERTFVTAPITYSAYRFARSLYGNKGYEHF